MPPVSVLNPERFDTFFQDPVYLECKRHLYNFLRRQEEVARFVPKECGTLLEIGAGSSPVSPRRPGSIYSDLSLQAMRYLRTFDGAGRTVVLSATEIPFKGGSIDTVVCSEVIEHIQEDRQALREMHRVLRADGILILTVPLHPYYFALDDRFVDHKRRYAVQDLLNRLQGAGFTDFTTAKVAGPVEKVTTLAAVAFFRLLRPFISGERNSGSNSPFRHLLPIYNACNHIYAHIIRWDAKIMPWFLTSIVLVRCRKLPESG